MAILAKANSVKISIPFFVEIEKKQNTYGST